MSNKRLGAWQGLLAGSLSGFFAATFGTLIHQTRLEETPIGVGLALGLVLWVSLSLRSRAKKSAGWLFTAILAVTLTIFSQPANDVMIPATDLGYWWSYGSIALAALVAAFPRLPGEIWSKKL